MKSKHRGYAVRSGYGPYLVAPGVPAGNPIDVENRWRVILAGNAVSPGRIVASCVNHAAARAAAILLATILLSACGGAPFTTDYASLSSGDDAQTALPVADAGQDSAPADASAFDGEGGGLGDGGGEEDPSTHAEASADLAIGPAGDASVPDGWIRSSDAAEDSPADSPASSSDGPKGLCCRTEVYPGCTLAWIPVDAGAVNDPCVDPTSCVPAGVVVPCP